ncbi:MAG: hypothetical protein WKF91_03115 [Segetibacter sp.]
MAAIPLGIDVCTHPDVLLNTKTLGLPDLLLHDKMKSTDNINGVIKSHLATGKLFGGRFSFNMEAFRLG